MSDAHNITRGKGTRPRPKLTAAAINLISFTKAGDYKVAITPQETQFF